MRPGTRATAAKALADGAMWAAVTACLILVPLSPGWTWLAAGCTLGFAALSVFVRLAAVGALPGGSRRGRQRNGGGLSGHGRDDDDGPAGEAVRWWPALVMVSRLMPRAAGRRWLAEAESVLAELTGARRRAAARSYLLSAPRLAVMMWARVVLRRAQPGPRRPR